MSDSERIPIVLVAAKEDVFNNIKDALAATNYNLLRAPTKDEAIALLEPLKGDIDLAIIEIELPDFAWALITQLRWCLRKPVTIIATTSLYPEPVFDKVRTLGVDAVVAKTIPPAEWRRAVEAVLGKIQSAIA